MVGKSKIDPLASCPLWSMEKFKAHCMGRRHMDLLRFSYFKCYSSEGNVVLASRSQGIKKITLHYKPHTRDVFGKDPREYLPVLGWEAADTWVRGRLIYGFLEVRSAGWGFVRFWVKPRDWWVSFQAQGLVSFQDHGLKCLESFQTQSGHHTLISNGFPVLCKKTQIGLGWNCILWCHWCLSREGFSSSKET